MKKYLVIIGWFLFCLFMFINVGCAGRFRAIKTADGIIFEGNKSGFSMSYKEDKDGNIEASLDSKGEPLINIGQIPDINK